MLKSRLVPIVFFAVLALAGFLFDIRITYFGFSFLGIYLLVKNIRLGVYIDRTSKWRFIDLGLNVILILMPLLLML